MRPTLPQLDDAWVLSRRPARNPVSADRPYAWLVEEEPTADGRLAEVVTVFLTNRECPFRCVMCDLWKNTLEVSVAPGAIVEQIHSVIRRLQLRDGMHLKLYNAGSFFDPNAIPPEDYPAIAKLAAPFERVIVECHPRLVGTRVADFHGLMREARGGAALRSEDSASQLKNGMAPVLEVAMGLETTHPEVLERLNKRMTLEDFAGAARRLREENIAVRAFVMVRPPFMNEAEGLHWAKRSIDFAFEHGVECCSLIPTRGGNGAMEELAAARQFAPPTLDSLEAAFEYGLSRKAGRVFLDLWDSDTISPQAPDREARIARLARMNRSQRIEP